MQNSKNILMNDLRQFTGTEEYHPFSVIFPKYLLTDGTEYLAETAGAYWLMDMIASYQANYSEESFVVARYAGTPNASGLFSLTDDIPANRTFATQSVEFSDFPLDEIKLYVMPQPIGDDLYWIILLPSEY
jgi:hypothetical protein